MGLQPLKFIGIIGSRRRNNQADLLATEAAFKAIFEPDDRIVSGGCPQGGDRFAELMAKRYQCPIIIFYAAWKQHGKAAGFIRNGDIALNSDILIACVATDRTGGTEDTIKKYLALGKDKLILV